MRGSFSLMTQRIDPPSCVPRIGPLLVQSRNPEISKWQGVGMFSLRLSYLPSNDERLQSRDKRSSAHPSGLTPFAATLQAQTQLMLVDEDKPADS